MLGINGYRAVIEAFNELPKLSKQSITPAGKIPPAKVFVIGTGVAGLAAIGMARNMGAIVRAFDSRPVTKEQVESLGAEFIELKFEEKGEGTGGYAKQMSEEFYAKQREMTNQQASEVDIIITTALIPNAPAPKLVFEETVRKMKPGSVIVDMASERGGNCELTKPGELFIDPESQVKIIGYTDLPSRIASQASELWSTNMGHLLDDLIDLPSKPDNNAKDFNINIEDEVQKGLCLIYKGEYKEKLQAPPPPPPKEEKKEEEKKGDQKKEEGDKKVPEKQISKDADDDKGKYHKIPEGEDVVEEDIENPAVVSFIVSLIAICLAIVIGIYTHQEFILQFGIFILTIFIGYMVIWNVTPALHTPLMSVTNAISGIIVIGCMQTMIHKPKDTSFVYTYSLLAFIGLFFASINVLGGFIVTQRMLEMFFPKKKVQTK